MRIVLATALALVIAIPADLAIEAFARQAFAVSPDLPPFEGSVAPYTAGGVILAGVVYAVVPAVAALMVMHAVAAAIVVTLLVRIAGARS